jgi:hypothetical protein
MQRRTGSRRALFALLPLLAAACSDRSPTVAGDEFFPGGERPTTLQAVVSSAGAFTPRGSFAGYAPAPGFPAGVLVANQYGGVLNAHGLVRVTGFPLSVDYTQGTAVRHDTLFTYGSGRLVALVDSAASVAAPTTLRFYRAGQKWDRATATWTTAVDTGSLHVDWTVPGGTPGPLVGQATWTPSAAGDSLVVALDSLTVAQLADSTFPGLLVTADEPGSLVQLASLTLRTRVHPKSAAPDTAIAQNVTGNVKTFIFTPEPPRSSTGALEVGGIRSARALFDLDLNQALPACEAGPPACGTLALKDVSINSVELLLRPLAMPLAFAPVGPVPLTVRTVEEPELGFRAPLGPTVDPTAAAYQPGDTVVAIPLTFQVQAQVARDSLTGSFALLSEPQGNTFGAVWFEPAPRLRITYTLPPASRLP